MEEHAARSIVVPLTQIERDGADVIERVQAAELADKLKVKLAELRENSTDTTLVLWASVIDFSRERSSPDAVRLHAKQRTHLFRRGDTMTQDEVVAQAAELGPGVAHILRLDGQGVEIDAKVEADGSVERRD